MSEEQWHSQGLEQMREQREEEDEVREGLGRSFDR